MLEQAGVRRRAALVVSIAVLASAVAGGVVQAATESSGETFPVSATASGSFPEGRIGQEVSISGDGRVVAFIYKSQDLDPEAPAEMFEAYVKDLDTGLLTLASRADGPAGAPANEAGPADVERPFISANGRYLAFETSADNLVAGLPPGEPQRHVYRRDLQTGTTVLVDRVTGPMGTILPSEARLQSISRDGRYVVFTSRVEDMEDPVGEHLEETETVYVRDLQEGTTTAVDRDDGPAGELASSGAEEGAISADGRYVLFTSAAPNLPLANGFFQVYRRDLQAGKTILVSRSAPTGASAPAGEPADGEAYVATFVGSSDCRVAFYAEGTTDLDPGGEDPPQAVYLRDFCGPIPTTTLVSVDENGEPFEIAESPIAADDGRIGFEAHTPPETRHFYMRDVTAGQTTLVDRATGPAGEPGGNEVEWNAIAANGCRAAFVTESTNLTEPEPPVGVRRQIYVRQLAPCVPKPSDPGPTPAAGAGRPAGPAPASAIGFQRLGTKALWLSFDGAGRACVRIQKLVGREHNWKLIKSVIVNATGAGRYEVDLAGLAPARYTLKFRLQGNPDNPTFIRALTISGGSKPGGQ